MFGECDLEKEEDDESQRLWGENNENGVSFKEVDGFFYEHSCVVLFWEMWVHFLWICLFALLFPFVFQFSSFQSIFSYIFVAIYTWNHVKVLGRYQFERYTRKCIVRSMLPRYIIMVKEKKQWERKIGRMFKMYSEEHVASCEALWAQNGENKKPNGKENLEWWWK